MDLSIPKLIGIDRIQGGRDDLSVEERVYAQYVADDGPTHGFVILDAKSDDGVRSPYAMFEVERARTGGGELFHVKSTYNHKYLRKASSDPLDGFISAAAESPDEDRSKWSCTLFRITRANAGWYQFQILFNNNERYIISWISNAESWFYIDLLSSSAINTGLTLFSLVDLVSLATLPRFVAFKGDNGKYLRLIDQHGFLYPEFKGDSKEEEAAQFEIIPRRNGTVLVRPYSFSNRFLSPVNLNRADSFFVAGTSRLASGLFHPIKLGVHGGGDYIHIALKHYHTGKYCRRHTVSESEVSVLYDDSLTPNADNIVTQAEIQVEDLVRSREMYNPLFTFTDSKIYEPSPFSIVTKNVVNRSNVSTQGAELSFSYAEFQSNSWNTTHSWQAGLSYNATISARLPILRFIRGEASVSMEVGYQGEHTVGKVEETTSQLDTKFSVSVPPMTMSKVSMVVSRAKMHVPYSYTQRDVLFDWSVVTTRKFDGVFEGENTHVDFEVEEESLS